MDNTNTTLDFFNHLNNIGASEITNLNHHRHLLLRGSSGYLKEILNSTDIIGYTTHQGRRYTFVNQILNLTYHDTGSCSKGDDHDIDSVNIQCRIGKRFAFEAHKKYNNDAEKEFIAEVVAEVLKQKEENGGTNV